jgi:polysaccharide biosynthesis/export protein
VCYADSMDCLAPRDAVRGPAALVFAAVLAIAAPLAAQSLADPDYRLGPNDEIRIAVLEDESLNGQRFVSADGNLTLPLVGEIKVSGQTIEQVASRIKAALERDYLRQATVTVSVVQARSQPITVIGAVQRPGTVFLAGAWRLSQAIAAAGGVSESSSGRAEIRRQAANGLFDRLEVDLDALLRRGNQSLDVPIMAQDVIHVLPATDITVYFLGAISSQGAVTIKGNERASLLTAIARAGGLTDRAASKVVIRRNREGDQPLEIVANFRRILAGSDPDVDLEDGDLIVVKEAFL